MDPVQTPSLENNTEDNSLSLPETQEAVNDHRFIKKLIIFTSIFFIIIISSLIYLFDNRILQNPNLSTTSNTQNEIILGESKQWTGCYEVRQVIKDGNTLYVGCNGGVLIVDATTNKVTGQITMAQGLGNEIVTNMLKKGDVLYIGSQDGFTKYDLITKKAEKIRVKEGLVNGSNIYLADDDKYIWVGTFDGLSRYNTETGEITNYTSELADNSTSYEVQKVLVTPKAVYVSVIANSESPGSIARFDKETNTWEHFGPSFFNQTGQYARVDFLQMQKVGDKIFASNFGPADMWFSEDVKGASWSALEKFNSKYADSNNVVNLYGSINDKLLLIMVNNVLYSYNIDTDESIKLPTPIKADVTSSNSFTNQEGNVLWFKNSEGDSWITLYDVSTNQENSITLSDRPPDFGVLLGVIDDKLLFSRGDSIWQQGPNDSFKKLITIKDMEFGGTGFSFFQPIPDSPNIFLYNQTCGQGCSIPEMAIYNYKDNTAKPVELPKEILNKDSSGSYSSLTFVKYDLPKNEFIFTKDKDEVTYNINTSSWKTISVKTLPYSLNQFNSISCNNLYTFAGNADMFKKYNCADTAQNNDYVWKVEKETPDTSLLQTNKKTQNSITLTIPAAEATYSPFKDNTLTHINIGSIIYLDNNLWVATNRGLGIYNTKTLTWKMITVADGLTSNNIGSFVVGKDYVWVLSGGLSYIKYK